MDEKNTKKSIGKATAFILCLVAIFLGLLIINGSLFDSVSIEGRGWADTLASVLFAGMIYAGAGGIAFILMAAGGLGVLIITISFIAEKLNLSIEGEERRLIKWALGMLTVKRLSLLGLLILISYGVLYYAYDEYYYSVRNSFYFAAYHGELDRVESLLFNRGLADLENTRAMRIAAEKGYIEIVRLLVDEDFPIHGRVLNKAAEHGHFEIVKLLVENGAKPQYADLFYAVRGGADIVSYLLDKGVKIKDSSALKEAAYRDKPKVIALLIEAGSELNECTTTDRYEPVRIRCIPAGLKEAIGRRSLEIARSLIEAGADVLALAERPGPSNGYRGRTYVQYAMSQGPEMRQLLESALELPLPSNVINSAQRGDWERLKRVVALGAEVNQTETSFEDTYGWSALMYAAAQGQDEIVKLLIEAGADVDYVSPMHETAVTLATTKNHTNIVNLLAAAGPGNGIDKLTPQNP